MQNTTEKRSSRAKTIALAVLLIIAAGAWTYRLTRPREQKEAPEEKAASPQETLNRKLFVAVRSGALEEVQDLLAEGAQPDTITWSGVPALHVAVTKGDKKIARVLLENGADPNIKHQRVGMTALHQAVTRPEMARLLLEHGADPDARGGQGRTALHACGQPGAAALEVARLLIEKGAHVNAPDGGGKTPLDVAKNPQQVDPSPELIALLEEHGAIESPEPKKPAEGAPEGRPSAPEQTPEGPAPSP